MPIWDKTNEADTLIKTKILKAGINRKCTKLIGKYFNNFQT